MAARSDGKGKSPARTPGKSGIRGARPAVPEARARTRGSGAAPRSGRRGAHAARRQGFRPHLPRLGVPGLGRLGALAIAALFAGGLYFLASGPWLRVEQVAWSGTHFVADAELARVLEPVKGANLLDLDSAELAREVEALPGVAVAHIDPSLPGGVNVAIEEQVPALVWQTSRLRLVAGDDGRIFGSLPLSAPLPRSLADLPLIDDQRMAAAYLDPGKVLAPDERTTALELAHIDPRSMGSRAAGIRVEIRDGCGYVLLPRSGASWEVALGYLGATADGSVTPPTIEAQVAAVRTLFAAHPERAVRWIDARNPGKVYWRANGPGGSDTC